MHGSECEPRETHGLADNPELQEPPKKDENSQKDVDCNADTNVLHVSHSNKNPSKHQLDNECLTECSSGIQQAVSEENSTKDKTFPEYRYPTIETMKIIPRRDQKETSVWFKTKNNGYTVIPVVKANDKQCDGQPFSSGAEISATFPQLHDYLDRLTSEFVVGHTDLSSNEIRRCSCIEGRCFTNWKIKRHGWNLPWQHMTSKDMLVSWDSVVQELQRLAGKAVDVKDISPLSASALIKFKDSFAYVDDESNKSSTYLASTTLEPKVLKNPPRLYDMCKAQLQTCNKQKAVSRYRVIRLERKNVNPMANRHQLQDKGNTILVPFLKVHGNSSLPIIKNDSFIEGDIRRTTLDAGSKNNATLLRFPTVQTCTSTCATNSPAHMVLNAKTGIHTSTPRTDIALQKPGNIDKQPKKRQRLKSPTETATLTSVKTVNNLDICLNKNQNALDSNCNDNSVDCPTVTQLLSHPLPTQKISVTQQVSSMTSKYNPMNQNALYRNANDTLQSANVFLRQTSGSLQQPERQSKLCQYSTSQSIDPLERVPRLGRSSTHGETFHLQKYASFPKKTFEKYKGVWDRISDEQSGRSKLTALLEPFKSCERIPSSTSKSSNKSKPQWDIDQIIKEHPRRIKGDSLYGISVNKAQTCSQLQKTSSEHATKTQRDVSNSDSYKTQYNNKSYSENLQRRKINEVLPTLVKPKTLMPPAPSVKRNEADEYQNKEVWYRHESVSRPNNYVNADTLLEMVSANPFNQSVESMMALRQFNCDINVLQGSISHGTIGPRSSPLPKIDTDRVSTFLPEIEGNSDVNFCYQHLPDLPDQKHSSMASESDSNEELPPIKNKDGRSKTSQYVYNERNTKTITDDSIKDAKEISNQRKQCAKFQTSIGTRTSPQQENKIEIEPGVESNPDELPRLSKSENCIKSKGFKQQNTSVCKSASSPGLPSSKYKVMVNNLTLTFTKLKDNKKTAKNDEEWHKHSHSSKESKSDKGRRKMHGSKTTSEQVNLDFEKQQSGLDKHKQNGKDDESVGSVDKRTKSSTTQCNKQNFATGCQMYDLDKVTKTIESKFKSEKTNSDMNGFDKPVRHLHTKKRWLIEYQQNTSNTLESVEEDNETTQHSEDLNGMVSLDSAQDESLQNTVLESNFQSETLLPDSNLEKGYEINLTNEDTIQESKLYTEDEGSKTLIESADVMGSTSGDTTYSEITDLAWSDEVLLVDSNELGLIEEVVDNVESVSMTDVTTHEENTTPSIVEKEENIQQSKSYLNVQTKRKVATASCDKDETSTPFEGSVYVFNDSKKGGSRKGSVSGVNIIRRSVRQHLSPRKSMAELSDNAIYSGNEHTTSNKTKKKSMKTTAKTKSASKARLCTAKKTSTDDLSAMRDDGKTLEASFGKSCVVKDRYREDTVMRDNQVNRSPECTSKSYTLAMDTDNIKKGHSDKFRRTSAKTKAVSVHAETVVSVHAETESESQNHSKIKQRDITKQNMTTANSAIQHLAAEQRRMMDIIKMSSPSQSIPSPASYSQQSLKSKADSSTMSSSSFSFVPIFSRDHKCKGGYAHLEGVTCPYVMMDGYKFVAIQDVLRMFPQCDKTCKVIRNVLVKYRGLSRTFCDLDQVNLLGQLFVLKGRSVKTGDMLLRVDSLVKHLPSIRDHVREEHLNLRRQGKSTLQCVQQQT